MIARKGEIAAVKGLLKRHPVVGIVGARQAGKTTLARLILAETSGPCSYFDLENPEDLAQLADPMLGLKNLRGLVVIDEIQRQPELFPVLRVLSDRRGPPARFLLLGSASPSLLRMGSETLAGRIYYHELGGFSLAEVGIEKLPRLWLRGSFPRSYLSPTNSASQEWRRGFIKTFLERDLPQLGISIRSTTLHRFWAMLAHWHGQVWNASEFSRSFGVADVTVRNYLDLLTSALVVRQLLPWHENISKRQVKSPKIYIVDSGLLHTLLGIGSMTELERHPKVGASWEGFMLEQIIRTLAVEKEDCYFWATHAGAELDLLVTKGNDRFGFEIKRTSSPRLTPSMKSALADLGLTRLDIIYPGESTFSLGAKVRAVGAARLLYDIRPIRRK